MPEKQNVLPGGNETVDFEGLARALEGDTVNTTPLEDGTILDTTGFLNALGYSEEEDKKKQDQQRTPTNYQIPVGPTTLTSELNSFFTNMFTRILTGAETGVTQADKHAEVLGNKYALEWMDNPVQLGDFPGDPPKFLENPVYKRAEENPEQKKIDTERINSNLHKLGTELANSTEKVRNRYRNLGLMDYGQGFWDSQWESMGQNLPYMIVGGGATKLGLTGVQMLSKAIAIPAFTLMEAGSHFGDMYSATAKKDKDGNVIEGTGDVEMAKRSIPFGMLAGSLEFWGVSQAVDLMGKLARNELKNLGIGTFAKEIGKVALSEGGEEISQDFIEQTNKLMEGLQQSYNLQEIWDSFVGGAVGGMMLAGFSVGANINNLSNIKKHAEYIKKEAGNLQKAGVISKEKAETYNKIADDVLKADDETLGKALENLGQVNKEIEQTAQQVVEKYVKVTNPPHIEATAKAISDAQKLASERPALKGTKAAEQADLIRENRKLVDMAATIDQVDTDVEVPNILDYTVTYGRNQMKSFLNGLNMVEQDKDYIRGEQQASIIASADPKTLHDVTDNIQDKVLKTVTERGLSSILDFVPKNETQLKDNVALGIALNFDDASWQMVKHNNRHIDNKTLDDVVNQAKAVQKSNRTFQALNVKGKTLQKEQSIKSVQAAARLAYVQSSRENIGLVRRELSSIIEEEKKPIDLSLKDVPMDASEISISDVGIETDPGFDIANHWDDIINLGTETLEESAPPVKMVAVAEKLPNGEIIVGKPGEYHFNLTYELAKKHPIQFMLDVVDGFVDANGKFYSRAEAARASRIKSFEAESIQLGVGKLPGKEKLYESGQIPSVSFRMPKYDAIIGNFQGNTFQQMYDYLNEVADVDPTTKEVLDEFLPLIADREITVSDLDPGTRGITEYTRATGRTVSSINKNAILMNPQDVWKTFVHEAVHNYLTGFIRSNTQAAKRFSGKINNLLQTTKLVLNTKNFDDPVFKELWTGSTAELIKFKQDNAEMIRKAVSNPDPINAVDEFLASIISDTQAIKWLTDRIKVAEKATVWMKIKKAFGNAFSQHGISTSVTRRVFEILQEETPYIRAAAHQTNAGLRPGSFNVKTMQEHNILSRNVSSGFNGTNIEDDLVDSLDPLQIDDPDSDENILENHNIEQFTSFMSAVNNQEPSTYREYLRTLNADTKLDGFSSYLQDIEDINNQYKNIIDRKLQRLYPHYKSNFVNFAEFKNAFLKRQYLTVTKKSAKKGVIFSGIRAVNPDTGYPEYSYELKPVQGDYVDGSGKKYNTYKYDVLLEQYIPKLEVVLGLPENTLEMVYVEGFEDVFNGEVTNKSNLTKVTPYTFNNPGFQGNKTGLLADMLWANETNRANNMSYLYIGNMGGKNTLPILSFPTNLKNKVRAALESYEVQYLGQVLETFKDEVGKENSEARRMGAVASALLEDMWYGGKFDAQEDGIKVQSVIAKEDMNKIMKRRRKWLSADTGIYFDEQSFNQVFKDRHFTGMELTPNDVIANAFIYDSTDDGSVTFQYRGNEVTLSMRDMLVNELGTPTTDGASFYIIGEFDDVYRHLHGALKSGALKNLYASRPGENPLYIKHAMHGVHKDSMIGQFMIQNNIAILVSDEAAKIGGKDIKGKISEHYNNTKIGADQIIKLKMSQFERMKEEQNVNPISGNMKQFIGGVSFSDLFNPVIKEAADEIGVNVNDILVRSVERAHATAQQWMDEHKDPQSWLELVREIVAAPQSPQEEQVAAMWANRAWPLEGQTDKDVLDRYQSMLNHPQTAEVLRNRMQRNVKTFLEGKIAGARVAIGPNVGYGNAPADVDPVTNRYNQAFFLLNYKNTDSEVLQSVLPEPGLIGHVRDLVELQRQEQRAHTFKSGAELGRELIKIQDSRDEVFTRIKSIDSQRLRDIFKGRQAATIHELMDLQHPKFKAWSEKMRDHVLNPNGQLKTKFTLIPEDIANAQGIKPGDRVIPIVTPLSGSVDLGAVTVAGIIPVTRGGKGRKAADHCSARFNSEWIQSILGKDFDIDTISLIPYHPDYWNAKDFNDLCDVLERVMDLYPQRTAETIKNIFDRKQAVAVDEAGMPIPINKQTIFTQDAIKTRLGQLMYGVPRTRHRTVFPILGSSFFDIDSAYLVNDTASSVAIRRMHGILSSLGVKADNVGIALMKKDGSVVAQGTKTMPDGTKKPIPLTINLNVKNPHWMDTHVTQAANTHAAVDFPNKTGKLLYNSDPMTKEYRVKTFEQIWGLNTDEVFNSILAMWQDTKDHTGAYTQFDLLTRALNSFHRMLFNDAILLSSGRSAEDYSNLDYYETRAQLQRARARLDLLARRDKAGMKAMWDAAAQENALTLRKQYGVDHAKYQEGVLRLKQQTFFIHSYIDKMEYGDVYSYPPFRGIQLMDPQSLPIPGNTYNEHLAVNTITVQNLIDYFPVVQLAAKNLNAHTATGSIFKIDKNVALKTAREITNMVSHEGDGNPINTVRWLLSDAGANRRNTILKRLNPSLRTKFSELLLEFRDLDRKAGQSYEPIMYKDQPVHVDEQNILFALLPQEMDYLYQRKGTKEDGPKLSDEYWQKQIRLVRSELNTIIQAFGEYVHYKPKVKAGIAEMPSESIILNRKAHETTYPGLFKALFDNRFLFFNQGIGNEIKLVYRPSNEKAGEEVVLVPLGTGELGIKFRGQSWTHNSLREAVRSNNAAAKELYDLFTQPDGLWKGIGDNETGSYNRYTVSQAIQLGRNIPMDVRQQLAREWLDKRLYGVNSLFTNEDKIAVWLSLLSQPSDQGARDNKATGFILSKSRADANNPLKYQSNTIAFNLLNEYEPSLADTYMALYGDVGNNNIEIDLGSLDLGTIRLEESAPPTNPGRMLRTFLSQYAQHLESFSTDESFVHFYNRMVRGNWKDGLTDLRKLANKTILLKALSESGIYYKDLVMDLKQLSDSDFMKKYGKVNSEDIVVALERYMGSQIGEQFLKQHVGEDNVAYRTRGNVIAMYWSLNGIAKREAKKNKTLGLGGKLSRLALGYDLTALYDEKKSFALTHKDELIGFSYDPIYGTQDMTTNDVQIAMKPFATRTYMPVGNSSLALAKSARTNRALTVFQVDLNGFVDTAENYVNVLSSTRARDKWQKQYAHSLKKNKANSRNDYISALLDRVPEKDNIQPEIRRQQIFDMAENLAKNYKIKLLEKSDGSVVYKLDAGKGYTFKRIEELIEKHYPSMSAADKISLLAAVELRRMYDIQVPKYIKSQVTYLERTRDELAISGNLTNAVQLNNIVNKYKDMLEAISTLKGNYMPHQFPIARYKEMWTKDYMQAMVYKIELAINKHQNLKRQNKEGYDPRLANMDIKRDHAAILKLAEEMTTKAWSKMTIGWNKGSIIPNFLPRKMPKAKGYTKTDPTTHLSYITKLIDGMRNDALLADWYMYQAQARIAGERHHVIELTRNWYAAQVNNTDLHSESIDIEDITRGQQISFNVQTRIVTPGFATGSVSSAIVSGVVSKVTKDEIHLDIDRDQVLYKAKEDLRKYRSMLQAALAYGNLNQPSQRQWIVLQNMINQGYVLPKDFANSGDPKDWKVMDVADLIVTGLERVVADPSRVGIYKKKDIWSLDGLGNIQNTRVNRYVHSGMIERIQARAKELDNIRHIDGRFDGALTAGQYYTLKFTGGALKLTTNFIKKGAGLVYMGLASAGKARFNNQMGAALNNIIDAPWHNVKQWMEARRTWKRISHGNLDLMEASDQDLYKTLVGLGLTEGQGIMSIALEAANIKPEEMLTRQSGLRAMRWLSKLWVDTIGYKPYAEKFKTLQHELDLEADPLKRLALVGKITNLEKEWEGKINGILSKEKSVFTDEELDAAWKQVEKMAVEDRKINLSKEQGITMAMATKLIARVAMQKMYTGNMGMGFQAKAEKLRIPAFFIGYYNAIECGFDKGTEAIQFGVNSVELRHAFYGSANKQYGANTTMGRLTHQFAQYQYNAASKALRIMNEAIPQILKFAHSRPQDVSRLKHLASMTKRLHTSLDAQGKALKRGEVTLKEVNLAHTILTKALITAVQMQVGTRIIYGLTNFADPVGQALYHFMEFIINMFQYGFNPGDDDDKNDMLFMLNDALLIYGLGYKLALQYAFSGDETIVETFYKGRADDTADFLDRITNDVDRIGHDLGLSDTRVDKQAKSFFDPKYLIDDFGTGLKLQGWVPADAQSHQYMKEGYFPGISSEFPFIFKKERKMVKSYGGGRYVETGGKGIGGIFSPQGRSMWRLSFLADPLTYIPFLDKFVDKKR